MKKIYALLFLTGLLTACGGTSVSTPEDIGPQVMDVLEGLGDMSKEDFKEHFMTLEEIRELGENEDLVMDEDGRNRLTKMEKSDRDEDLEKSFSRLIENGAELDIEWSEVEFEDFSYEVETDNGIKTCQGDLTFLDGKDKFRVSTISIYDGSGYNLVSLRGPYKKR